MREAFEKWALEQDENLTRAGGHEDRYAYPRTALLWHAWQAAYAAGLERAAEIVEHIQWPVGNSAAGEMAAEWTGEKLREARDAIRAAKGE